MTIILPERPENPHRLGRHQWADPMQEKLDARKLFGKPELPTESVEHKRNCDPWNQGELGSCTANAAMGTLMTDPYYSGKWKPFTEDDCVNLYKLETRLDENDIPGEYPPEDTGSTGPWSMRALAQIGYVKSYRHATDYVTALNLLIDGPISIGVSWYQSMFEPDDKGQIHVDTESDLAGGHQISVVGLDVDEKLIKICNSWGVNWGVGGYCYLSWDDFDYLLKNGGDAVQPVL